MGNWGRSESKSSWSEGSNSGSSSSAFAGSGSGFGCEMLGAGLGSSLSGKEGVTTSSSVLDTEGPAGIYSTFQC